MNLRRALRKRILQRVAESGEPLGGGDQLEALQPSQVEQIRRFFPRKKFFLFGHPRSGTTLLGRLIDLHPEVHCNWNARFFSWDGLIARVATPAFEAWFESQGNRWVEEKGLETAVLRVMCDFVMEQDVDETSALIIGDKTPNLEGAQAVDWLSRLYPDARLLVIVRDGRDAVLSMRVRAFIDYPETLSRADLLLRERIRRDNKPYFIGERSLFTPAWLRTHARQWEQNVRTSHTLALDLMPERYKAIRFEDLLENPINTLHDVWRFLGVRSVSPDTDLAIRTEIARNPKADWHDQADPELVNGLRRGVRGGWREVYTRDDLALFNEIAAGTLAAWGYEADA